MVNIKQGIDRRESGKCNEKQVPKFISKNYENIISETKNICETKTWREQIERCKSSETRVAKGSR